MMRERMMLKTTLPGSWRVWLLALSLLLGMAGPVRAQGGESSGGLRVVGRFGGTIRALAALPEGRVLLAEDEALLLLDADGQLQARVTIGRGAVQTVAVRGQLAYVLTEQGVSVRQVADWAELAFQPGGGQALYLGGRAIYVAAQAAGIRAAALDRRGLPGAWQAVLTPAPALALTVDPAERTLYAALGEAGIAVYTLPLDGPPQLAGVLDGIGWVDSLRIEGARLLAISGHRLLAFDLSPDPTAPRLEGAYTPLHDAADVLLRHEWAYIADRAGGLRRFSVAALERPQPDGEPIWEGPVHALVDDARYLYAAAGWEGLVVFDVGRLDRLALHSQLALPGHAATLALREDGEARWLLAGLGDAGAALVSWEGEAAPRLRAVIATDAPVRAVALRDRLAFIGLDSGQVQVYSLASPEAPRLLASLSVGGVPQGFAQDGTLLFVAAGSGGLIVIDTIRPADPAILGRTPPLHPDQPFTAVALEGGKRAYLSAGSALVIMDVDVVESPQILAVVAIPAAAAAARNFIVYAAGGASFTTVNAASSNQPRVLGMYRALTRIAAVAARGTHAWLAGAGDGLAARGLTLEAGRGPAEIPGATVTEAAAGRALAWAEDGALLLLGTDGSLLRQDGSEVRALHAGQPGGEALLALGEERLLMAGAGGWAALDVHDPAHPQPVAAGVLEGEAYTLAGDAAALYFAAGERGVGRLADLQLLSGRWQPAAAEGAAQAVAVWEAFTLVAESGPGPQGALRVLAADTLAPITAVPLPGPARALAVEGGRAYVSYAAGQSGGLAVVDLGAPLGGLTLDGMTDLPAEAVVIASETGLAYAVSGATLTVLDLSGWPVLTPVSQVALPQPGERLARIGGTAYLAVIGAQGGLLLDTAAPQMARWPQPVAALPLGVEAAGGGPAALLLGSAQGMLLGGLESLVGVEGRLQRLHSGAVSALWQADGLWYAGGPGGLWAFDGRDPLAVIPRGQTALPGQGPVEGLFGLESRRGDHWLYAVQDGALWAVQHRADGAFGAPVRLAEGLRALLAADARALYAAGEDGRLHVLTLKEPDALDWGITYPLPGGPVTGAQAWGERVLVSTAVGIYALEWGAARARPPALVSQLEGFAAGAEALVSDGAGLLWLAGGDMLWQVDGRAARPTLVGQARVMGEARALALLPDGGPLAVAAGACGVRLVERATLEEIGFWHPAGEITTLAVLDGLLAAGDQDGVTLLALAPGEAHYGLPAPHAPQPPDGASGAGGAVTLHWQGGVNSCLPLHYEVWVAEPTGAPVLVGETTAPSFPLADLALDHPVRWQVRVVDNEGRVVSAGPEWVFTPGEAAEAQPADVLAAQGPGLTPTPLLPGDAPQTPPASDTAAGFDARQLAPFLIGGVLLEVLLLAGLWAWWGARRRAK